MKSVNCTVQQIEALTNTVHKVILLSDEAVEFKAGQYIQAVMGENDNRPFSIASTPAQLPMIELHIGADPANGYAYEVLKKCEREGEIELQIALGEAYLRPSPLPLVIVAGGTGYSYAKSLVYSCISQQPERAIKLYWGAKSVSDLYELHQLEALAQDNSMFTFIPVVEQKPAVWEHRTGLVHEAVLTDYDDLVGVQVYTAGRFEMAAVIREVFSAKNLLAENLIGDAYAFI